MCYLEADKNYFLIRSLKLNLLYVHFFGDLKNLFLNLDSPYNPQLHFEFDL